MNKKEWLEGWCAREGLKLDLEGECGFGRECVGVVAVRGKDDYTFPDYEWYDDDWNRADSNGEVWRPKDAYHKHPCVAVLGRGEEAVEQLYDWCKWFEDNSFHFEDVHRECTNEVELMLGRDHHYRMARK